jgi:hypothetical protein
MGAVRCDKHGTHVAGPSCCDHVRTAVYRSLPLIPFGNYRFDVLGDGTLIAGDLLCADCASKCGLSVDEIASAEVWTDDERFPSVCPVCAQCFKEWMAQG